MRIDGQNMDTYDRERTLEPVAVHHLGQLVVDEPTLLARETLERLLENPRPTSGLEERSVAKQLDQLVDEPGSHVVPGDHLEHNVLTVLSGDDGLEVGLHDVEERLPDLSSASERTLDEVVALRSDGESAGCGGEHVEQGDDPAGEALLVVKDVRQCPGGPPERALASEDGNDPLDPQRVRVDRKLNNGRVRSGQGEKVLVVHRAEEDVLRDLRRWSDQLLRESCNVGSVEGD
jgi:hypothetical protein